MESSECKISLRIQSSRLAIVAHDGATLCPVEVPRGSKPWIRQKPHGISMLGQKWHVSRQRLVYVYSRRDDGGRLAVASAAQAARREFHGLLLLCQGRGLGYKFSYDTRAEQSALTWVPALVNNTLARLAFCTCRMSWYGHNKLGNGDASVQESARPPVWIGTSTTPTPLSLPPHKVVGSALPNLDSQEIRIDLKEARALLSPQIFPSCGLLALSWKSAQPIGPRFKKAVDSHLLLSPTSVGPPRVFSSLYRPHLATYVRSPIIYAHHRHD